MLDGSALAGACGERTDFSLKGRKSTVIARGGASRYAFALGGRLAARQAIQDVVGSRKQQFGNI